MATIRPRTRADGSTAYDLRFRWEGRQSSVVYATQQDAEHAREFLEKYRRHPLELEDVDEPRTIRTVAQVVAHHVSHLTGVTERTRADYIRDNRLHIEATKLGALPVDVLTRDDVKAWVNDRALILAPKTVRNVHGLLAAAMNTALDNDWARKNPCKGVKLPTDDNTDDEMVFLEHDEFGLLHGCLPDWAQPLTLFLVATGMRWSEATALQVGDLNLTEKKVRVLRAWKRQPDNSFQLGPPKTRRSRRTVDLPPQIVDMLRSTVTGRARTEWVFLSATGKHIRHNNFYNRAWVPAVRGAHGKGLTKTPRIHDLRHTHAAWCIAANIGLTVIRDRLGHESITTTVDRYGHLMSGLQAAAAMAIGAALPRQGIESSVS